MTDDDPLVAALAVIQARGAIGETSLPRAIEHAEQYVRAIPADAVRVADLGSGGGLPGLVIAVRRPDLHLVLVERRATRADLLRRAVASLHLSERVEVLADDVKELARRSPAGFDAVTARSFAAPAVTAHWAGVLLKTDGLLIVSEPPESDAGRWPRATLADAGLHDLGRTDGIRRLRRTSSAA